MAMTTNIRRREAGLASVGTVVFVASGERLISVAQSGDVAAATFYVALLVVVAAATALKIAAFMSAPRIQR